MYRWESEDRYLLEIYEDEEDEVVVDYTDETEIASGLIWDWSFEKERRFTTRLTSQKAPYSE